MSTDNATPSDSQSQQKPHISPSQINMIAMCPESYRRRYIEKEIIPPGIAMLRGRGLHTSAQTNMEQKLTSREDLPAADIVDCAVQSFDTEIAGGYSLNPEESSRGARVVIGEAKDDLARMAGVHASDQAPHYQPQYVEQKIRIQLDGPRDLLGIIDLADEAKRIIDFKTAKKKKSQSDADSSIQLTTYGIAYRAVTGHEPRSYILDTAVATKTKAYRSELYTHREPADLQALANRIDAVCRLIEAGTFPPCDPNHWKCSPAWCGYFSTCPFTRAGCSYRRGQGD